MSEYYDAMTRRKFLSLSAAASAGLALSGVAGSSLAAN
jgi:hypothetical protein